MQRNLLRLPNGARMFSIDMVQHWALLVMLASAGSCLIRPVLLNTRRQLLGLERKLGSLAAPEHSLMTWNDKVSDWAAADARLAGSMVCKVIS